MPWLTLSSRQSKLEKALAALPKVGEPDLQGKPLEAFIVERPAVPGRKVKRPNKFKTWTSDKYWTGTTAELRNNVNQLVWTLLAYERKESTPLIVKDKLEVADIWEKIQAMIQEWERLVETKGSSKRARELSLTIEEWWVTMDNLIRDSFARALERKGLDPGFTFLKEHASRALRLGRIRDEILPCDICIRASEINRIIAWLEGGHDKYKIHWICGLPRSGKTTLMHNIALAATLVYREVPVASLIFTPDFTLQDLKKDFLPTLLDQLCCTIEGFREALASIASQPEFEPYADETLENRVRNWFVPAYERLPTRWHPFIIILDSLERCEPPALVGVFDFVEMALQKLPARFIISGRIDPHSTDETTAPVEHALTTRAYLFDQVERNEIQNFRVAYEQAIAAQAGKPVAEVERT